MGVTTPSTQERPFSSISIQRNTLRENYAPFDLTSPYNISVTFLHTHPTYTYTYTAKFTWSVEPAIILGSPGEQLNHIGDTVDIAIPVVREFGQPITFSASGLPLGLSINPQTGHNTGKVGPQTSSHWAANLIVSATDGVKTGTLSFPWYVIPSALNVVQLADSWTGGTITLTSPAGTSLGAQLSSPGDVGYPANRDFTSSILGLSVEGLEDGAATEVSVVYSLPGRSDGFYVYGLTPEFSFDWYNFQYQPQSSPVGAEFLSNGHVILHLVDGAFSDSDFAADGAVALSFGALTAPAETFTNR